MPPLPLPATALYASLTALLILYLAYRVTVFRRGRRIAIGDGNDADLSVAIRAHANAVEYAPTSFILLAVAELNGLAGWAAHSLGGLILVSRMLHAYGFTVTRGGVHFGRFWGIVLSWLAILLLAGANLALMLMR